MKSKIKIAIFGLVMISIIETTILLGVAVTQDINNLDQRETNMEQEKERFNGSWKCRYWHKQVGDVNNITSFRFEPDGTVEINGSTHHFGMGVESRGYALWNGTWDLIKIDNGNEYRYILVISNISRAYPSIVGLLKGLLDSEDSLYLICEIKEKLHGNALYIYDDVFEMYHRFDRMD